MATLQGEMLTRIARAHKRAVAAEYALQDAKEALKKTRESNDMELAKAEKKAAALELAAALDETTQLPLPQMSSAGFNADVLEDVARQVNAGALGSKVTATVKPATGMARVVTA